MARLKAFRVTLGLALLAIGFVLACIPDDWIETVSGFSPDNGNGLAEAALAGVPITAGCVLRRRRASFRLSPRASLADHPPIDRLAMMPG